MSIIETYLDYLQEDEYLNESKWKALLRTGKLSKKALRKIQKYKLKADPLYVKSLIKKGQKAKADEYLKKKGIVKSARQWLAGVEKGSQNILKKTGTNVQNKPNVIFSKQTGLPIGKNLKDPMHAHAVTSTKKSTMHVPSGLSKKQQGLSTLIKRHETDEVRMGKKKLKAAKANLSSLQPTSSYGHLSDEVLRREKELTNTAAALYGKKSGANTLRKLRKQTGEYDAIKHMTKKDIAKQDKALTTQIKNATKQEIDAIKKLSPEQRKEVIKGYKQQLKATMPTNVYKRVLKQFKSQGLI